MKRLALAIVAISLSGCSGPPALVSGTDPSDPSAPVPAVEYVPVTAGTADYRPVAPNPWAERNERVAPRAPGGAR